MSLNLISSSTCSSCIIKTLWYMNIQIDSERIRKLGSVEVLNDYTGYSDLFTICMPNSHHMLSRHHCDVLYCTALYPFVLLCLYAARYVWTEVPTGFSTLNEEEQILSPFLSRYFGDRPRQNANYMNMPAHAYQVRKKQQHRVCVCLHSTNVVQ